MAKAASVLISRSNQLKKNAFERINAKYSDEWAKDAERLEKAKTGHEHRMILAEHFWQRWIVELLFEGDKNADVRENLPDLKATIQAKWDKMAEEYPTRWAKAVRAEYDTQMKKKNFAPLKAELDKAISNVDQFEVADKLQSLLDAETNKKDADNTKLQLLSDLMNYIHIATDELAYFTGTIFIYELGDFLDKLASDVLERARPFTTRLLKYYEEYRVRRGEGGPEGLKEEAVLMLGHQYFQIGDWNNTIKYLSNYVERFGGEKTWGKEESIPVDERNNRVGKTGSANELEVKYQLGKAYLELYKEDKDIEKLKKAALLMRRCWSFNLLRDANKKMNDKYTLLFQNELEDIFVIQDGLDVGVAHRLVGFTDPPPAVPQEQLVPEAVGHLVDHLVEHEALAAEAGYLRTDAVGGRVELAPAEADPHLGCGDESRAAELAAGNVHRARQRRPGIGDLGVEAPPPPGEENPTGPARVVVWKPISCVPDFGNREGKRIRIYRHARMLRPVREGGRKWVDISAFTGYLTCR